MSIPRIKVLLTDQLLTPNEGGFYDIEIAGHLAVVFPGILHYIGKRYSLYFPPSKALAAGSPRLDLAPPTAYIYRGRPRPEIEGWYHCRSSGAVPGPGICNADCRVQIKIPVACYRSDYARLGQPPALSSRTRVLCPCGTPFAFS